MIFEFAEYRPFLRSVLAEKKSKNPAFSLRSFSSKVGLTQPAISQVLSKKRNLSQNAALRIAHQFGLNESESGYFCAMVQLETTKDPVIREPLLKRLSTLNPKRDVTDLSVDYFRMVSDWYHLVIRNIFDLTHFRFDPTAIAKRLGISKIEVEAAVERLLRLGLLEPDPKNKIKAYKKSKGNLMVRSEERDLGLKNFHRQMLEKAISSIDHQSPREKVSGSQTFAFSAKNLDEARKITEEYFSKMDRLSEKPGEKTDVYHLALQFFNVTKEEA